MAEDAMDNLTRDAVAARDMGMTYGKYMAYKQCVDVNQRQKMVLMHERLPVCVSCGKPIPKGSRNRKYCGPECALSAHDRSTKESKLRRRKKTVNEDNQV